MKDQATNPSGGACALDCPCEQVWVRLAVGDHVEGQERHIEHAAGCAVCCSRLKHAVELTSDRPTDEEKSVLAEVERAQQAMLRAFATLLSTLQKPHPPVDCSVPPSETPCN